MDWCPLLLREHDQPLGEIMSLPEFATQQVVVPQSPQHWKQLGRPAELIAQRPGPAVGAFNLRNRVAPGCHQRTADRYPQRKFLIEILRLIGQRPDKLEPFAQVSDRFQVCRAPSSQLAGAAPIRDRPRRQARVGQMLRQHLRPGFASLRRPLLEHLGDPGVQALAWPPSARRVPLHADLVLVAQRGL